LATTGHWSKRLNPARRLLAVVINQRLEFGRRWDRRWDRRCVAFVLAGDMAVAQFIVHAPRSFFPLLNGGELAIVYCFVFLYFWVAGGGEWSLDRLRAHAGQRSVSHGGRALPPRPEAADQRPRPSLQANPEELPHPRRQVEGGNIAGHSEQFQAEQRHEVADDD
jgi:hypothetical protein